MARSGYSFGGSAKAKHTFNIEHFRGVDFASNAFEVAGERSPEAVNLIPSSGGWPQTRPGVSERVRFSGQINGIHTLYTAAGRVRLVHHGSRISHWQADGSVAELYSGVKDEKSSAVQLKDKLLILDGLCALVASCDEDGEVRVQTLAEAAYVPTTMIGRKAGEQMGGEVLEAQNLIGTVRRNTFCVSEEGQTELYMDSAPVKKFIKAEALSANGIWAEISWESEDLTEGKLTFDVLGKTPVSGMDNVRVEFAVEQLGGAERQEKWPRSAADKVDSKGLRVWYWPSSGNEAWAKKYWFKIGENLPKEKVALVIVPGDTYYHWSTHGSGAAYPKQYAVSLSADDGEKRITLGCLSDSYYEYEEESDHVMYLEAQLVQESGVWYVTVVQPHSAAGGGDGKAYIRDIDSVVASWQESDSNVLADKINGCTVATLFGVGGNADRAFVSGNRAHKNMDWMSGFEDVTYFPEDGYTRIGSEGSAVVGYSRLADGVLAVHKEDSAGDSTIWYRNGGLDSLGEAQFTLKQGAVGVGAVSGRCFAHFGADSLVLSKSGVYAITHVGNEAVNERYAQLKSWFVNPRLCAEDELGEAVAVGFGGRYYLAVNGHVYVADTAAGSSYESRGGGYQYDWWYWEGVPVRVWYTAEDELMFGTADGRICALDGKCYDEVDGERRAIRCHWLTPVLDLGTRVYYKKIKNAYAVAEPYNRSCVKMAYVLNSIESEVLSRDMSVFDFADLDFGDLAFETDEAPRNVPSGAKAKKVMFIQFKLYNEPGKDFGLYGLSVLYTIGGKYKG